MKLLSIQEVANILGVSGKTLRRWEEKGILIPLRTPGNQRRYTHEQVANFRHQKAGLSKTSSLQFSRAIPSQLPSQSYSEQASSLQQNSTQIELDRTKRLLSIQEVANILGVSGKTLRRWEEKGILVPLRTRGNQRRYMRDQVDKFREEKGILAPFEDSEPELQTVPNLLSQPTLISQEKNIIDGSPGSQYWAEELVKSILVFKKLAITAVFVMLFVAVAGVGIATLKSANLLNIAGIPKILSVLGIGANKIQAPELSEALTGKAVLGAGIKASDLVFDVNVKSRFADSSEFLNTIKVFGIATLSGGIVTENADINAGTGELTASNVLYGVVAGSGISVGPGQTPIITNTGVLSLGGSTGALNLTAGTGISISGLSISSTGDTQSVFKTIAVTGSSSLTASSSTDTLTFEAGTGITLATNTSSKTVTIAGAAGASGWQRNDGALSPANITDDLLLGGISTSTAKFAFINNAGGIPTASIAGNLTLDSVGVIQTTKNQTLKIGGNTTGEILILQNNQQLLSATGGASLKNFFAGLQAGFANTSTANNNTGIGYQASFSNTAGDFNTAVGSGALYYNTASNNTGIGYQALYTNTTGSSNVGVGYQSLFSNTTGGSNVALGYQALNASITGSENTALGYQALAANTTGSNNIAIGYQALNANTTGGVNIAIGYQALAANIGNNNNLAIGYQALAANTGSSNTAVGTSALSTNISGVGSTAFGYLALQYSTGSFNTALGAAALNLNTTGVSNTAVGGETLAANTTGSTNTGLGASALNANTTGSSNTSIGALALGLNTTGGFNTAIGYRAGYTSSIGNANDTGSNNTFIGYNAGPGTSTQLSNAAAIGNAAVVSQDNSLVLGGISGTNGATSDVNIGIGTATPLSPLDIEAGRIGGRAALIVNQNGAVTNDIFTASASGTTRFRIANTGELIFGVSGSTSFGTLDLATLTANRTYTFPNATGTVCLSTNNCTPDWTLANGLLRPGNSTVDLAIGGQSSASAKFAVLNMNSGTPVASVSAAGAAIGSRTGLVLGADSTIQSLQKANLTLGGSTTGGINFLPGNIQTAFLSSIGRLGIGTQTNPKGLLDISGNSGGNSALIVNQTGSLSEDLLTASASGTTRLTITNKGFIDIIDGTLSTAVGYQSLGTNTTGTENTAVGYRALVVNTLGGSNTAIGYTALAFSNTTGSYNTAVGSIALFYNTASNNTAVGYKALTANTTGSSNTALGYNAGYTNNGQYSNQTGGNNVYLGYNAGPWADGVNEGPSGNFNNSTAIGAYSLVYGDNSLVLGGTAFYAVNVGIGTATPSAVLDIQGGQRGGRSALIVNQTGASTNDIFTASSSGTTKFTITNGGNIQFAGSTSFLTTLTSAATAARTYTFADSVSGDVCILQASNCFGVGGGGIAGSGTTNYVAKFTGTNNIGNSQLYDNGTNVGIGTANPLTTLDVRGAASVSGAFTLTTTPTIQSTTKQTLILGGDTTGGINFLPGNVQTAYLSSIGRIGLGTQTNPKGLLDIAGNSGGNAALIVNQTGSLSEDIFTASSSGVPKFTISNTGVITDAAYTNAGGILYTATTGIIGQTAIGTSSQCLLGGTIPSFGSCGSGVGTDVFWNQSATGLLFPNNSTVDFAIGGQSSASAKFAVLNVNSGTPTATVAGNLLVMPYTSGASQLGGNVGIGTTAPNQLLHLSSSASSAMQITTTSFLNKRSDTSYSFTNHATLPAGATVNWTNPSNAQTSDNSYATINATPSWTSNYLIATRSGLLIPSGAVIKGILVEVEKSSTLPSPSLVDNSIKIVKGGSISGSERSAGASWSDTDAYSSYGGSSDLWGLSWTPADINASNFGVGISAACTGGANCFLLTAQIDHIRITVYYTSNDWVVGTDTQASGNFTISNSTSFGTNAYNHLTIDTSGNASIAGSLDFSTYKKLIAVVEGDSISDTDTSSFAWPAKLKSRSPYFGKANFTNYAVAGQVASEMVTQYATEAHTKRPINSGDEAWFFIWAGSNDINTTSETAAFIYNNLKSLWASARADRFKVVAFTILPGTQFDAAEEVRRVELNRLILSDPSLYDFVIRADIILPNPSDTTYYYDGAHLSGIPGHVKVADLIDSTIFSQPWLLIPNLVPNSVSPTAMTLMLNPTGGNIGIGTASPSAVLEIQGRQNSVLGGTIPVASVSGKTSFAAMIVDNSGAGDIFTASSSGLNRFVIKQNGNVGIGSMTIPKAKLTVGGDYNNTGYGGILLDADPIANPDTFTLGINPYVTDFLRVGYSFRTKLFGGTSRDNLTLFDTGQVGIGSTANLIANLSAQLHVTRPLSFGATGKALAVFDQIENQDILTASVSGTTKLTITKRGFIDIIDTLSSTAVGYQALSAITSGTSNTAFGYQALTANTSGTQNTAVGYRALYTNVGAGNDNTAVGFGALFTNTIGDQNTAVGVQALNLNSIGLNSTAIGYRALANSTASDNTAVGSQALYTNGAGVQNIAVGDLALYTNSSGVQNTAVGSGALRNNDTSSSNTALGYGTLFNTTTSDNTAVGSLALYTNSTGLRNTAVGKNTLFSNTTGAYNTAMGYYAISNNDVGSQNTAIGYEALLANNTGSSNTAVGYNASYMYIVGLGNHYYNLTGNNNTYLGYNASPWTIGASFNNTTAIGAFALVNASNSLVLGGTGFYAVNVGIGTATPSAVLDIQGGQKGGNAALIVNQTGAATNDLFTASASGLTKFKIENDGDLVLGDIIDGAGINRSIYMNTIDGTDDQYLSLNGGGAGNDVTRGAVLNLFGNEQGLNGYAVLAAGNVSGGAILFQTAATTRLSILNDGNIGIGTLSPLASLDVRANPTIGGTIPVASVSGKTSFAAMVVDNSGLGDIFTASSSGLNRFVIAQGGNVGIGMPIPTASLAIYNALDSTDSLRFTNTTAGLDYWMGIQQYSVGFANVGYKFRTTNASGTTRDSLAITGAGRIGIGTTTPISELHVTRPLSFPVTGAALAIFDQLENQDILTASSSGNTKFTITNGGSVQIAAGTGISTGSGVFALNVFQLPGSEATAAAQIWNSQPNTGGTGACTNSLCHTALSLKLGASGSIGDPGSPDRFVNFARGDGTILGKVRGNGSGGVAYDTTGGDYAEWFQKEDRDEHFDYGDIVCLNQNGKVVKCDTNNRKILGAITDTPGFVGNSGNDEDPSYILVGLLGQIRIKVSTENGPIKGGDMISYSTTKGVGAKAITTGFALARAIGSYDGTGETRIQAYVNPTWYDPSVYLGLDGNLGGVNSPASSEAAALALGLPGVPETPTAADGLQTTATQSAAVDGSLFAESEIIDLKNRVASAEAQIDDLRSQIINSSTQSAFLTSITSQPAVLGASTSADFVNDLSNLDISSATISENLMVLGRTTTAELGVTGNIAVGLMSIHGLDESVNNGNGGATINSVGDLNLQNNGLGGINILSGKVTIDTQGNIKTEGEVTAKKIKIDTTDQDARSLGSGVIGAGETSVTISTTAVTGRSRILVTPTTKTGNRVLVVSSKSAENGFTVTIEGEYTQDIKFDWWIVDEK